MTKALEGRIALVTGASRGIGRAICLEYARKGAHVIAIARTSGALEELDDEIQAIGGTATLVPLDLTDFEAINRIGQSLFERWGHLDILVGNAGILGPMTPLGHIDPKDWTGVMDLNVTANWRLIRSLDPLLQASDAGRALFVTSGAAHKHRPFWGPYAISKAALESLALTYAAECKNGSVRINLVNPGPIRTGMRASAMPGEDPTLLKTPEDIAPLFVELGRADCQRSGEIINFQN